MFSTLNRSSKIALATVIIAILWLLTGLFRSNSDGKEKDTEAQEQKMLVRVKTLNASQKTNTLVLRGVTEPHRTVTLQAETHGRVMWVTENKGKQIQKDDVIVRLDAEERKARAMEAEAALNALKISYEAEKKLFKKGISSKAALLDAEAKVDGAEATFKRAQIELNRTEIRAPFDALVQDTFVEVGNYVNPNGQTGSNIATVIELDPLITTIYVTENDLPKIKVGGDATLKRSDGQTLKAKVSYVAGNANTQTKTFKIELKSDNPEFLPAGMTTEVIIPYEAIDAHLISPALLTLDNDGQIGVKRIDEKNIVRFVPISIIDNEREGVWVKGLPKQVTLIVVGGEFVRADQEVIPQDEDAKGEGNS